MNRCNECGQFCKWDELGVSITPPENPYQDTPLMICRNCAGKITEELFQELAMPGGLSDDLAF